MKHENITQFYHHLLKSQGADPELMERVQTLAQERLCAKVDMSFIH